MDSEKHVMLMQQGESGVMLIAHYDTLEQRFFSFQAWSAIEHYDTRSQPTMGRVISPHPDHVKIGYFCYSKKCDRETFDSVIVKLNI